VEAYRLENGEEAKRLQNESLASDEGEAEVMVVIGVVEEEGDGSEMRASQHSPYIFKKIQRRSIESPEIAEKPRDP
jgi:hypothetical protein